MKASMKKRTISSIVSFTMLLSTTPMVMADWTAREDVDLRVGILGDVHLQPENSSGNYAGEDYLIKSLEATKTLSNGKLDVMVLTGDVTYQTNGTNYTNHYDRLYKNLNEYVPGIPLVYAMGNHEYILNSHQLSDKNEKDAESRQIFEEKTGQTVNYHYETEDGYHFIAAAAEGYLGVYSDETQSWLMQEIDSAIAEDPNKPVFVDLHHPVDNTVVDNKYDGYNDTFEAYIKTKPQVINLTAHHHAAAQIPQTIYQDGFTAFQTPLTAIGQVSNWKCNSGEVFQVHQGAMIEVTDNVVSIYKYDLDTQEYIGEPWVIDVPAIVADRSDTDTSNDNDHYLYSADKRSNPATPVWGEGAALSVRRANNSVEITYPNNASVEAQPNQQDGFIAGYKVELTNTDGEVITETRYVSDYFEPESEKIASYTQKLSNLGYSNTFTVNVYPMTPWKTFGQPLSTEVTTQAERVPDRAVTYEFEDAANTDSAKKAILNNEYANAGAMLVSAGGYGEAYLQENDNPSFDFTVNLPSDDTYTIDYVLGQRAVNDVSLVKLSIDGNEIGTNAASASYTEDLSLNKTFPWSYLPLRKYTAEMALTAGEHTVSLTVDPCQVNGDDWLYLFAADYIRFTPNTIALPEGVTEIDLIRDENGTLRTGVDASTDFPAYSTGFNIAKVIDGDNSTFWFSQFYQYKPYITLDLGGVKCITEIKYLPANGNYANVEGGANGGWYFRAGQEIQLSNSKDFDEYVTVASLPYKTENSLALGQTLDAVLDGSINKYRYIRIAQQEGGVVGASEISVKGYELSADDYSDVTVESVSFTSTPEEVTNIDNDELIEINFSEGADLTTATSDNIYVVDANNAKTSITPVIIDSNTVGIYPGELLPYKTYNVVVSGMMDVYGVPMAMYKSEGTFTTGDTLSIPYTKDMIVENVARNKSVYRASDDSSLNGWTDGNEISDAQGDTDNWLKGGSDDYGIVDLGKAYNIVGVGIMSTTNWWNFAPTDIYGTNDPECKLEDAELIAAITQADGVNAEVISNAVKKPIVSAKGGTYRYILFKPNGGDGILGKEVYVYANVDNTPVTIAKTANVTDGMEKITNVSNTRPAEGYTYAAKPMEITLSDNADMSTVSNTTLTVNDGTKNVAYTPVIDGKTVKIDLSELDSNLTYTVTVTNGVKSESGAGGCDDSFTFTTGLIAKVPYTEGEVIRNAAYGKNAWKSTEEEGSSSFAFWTDSVEGNGGAGYLSDYADTETPGVFGIIDLGNEYEIKAVGVRGNNPTQWWNYYSIDFYCMNEIPANGAGLENDIGKLEKDLCALTTGPVIKAEASGRYIMIKKTDTTAALKEVYVFVSVPADSADVFFTTDNTANTVTANVQNGGNNKLILASYDAGNNLGEVVFGTDGAASITKADGYTYKAFLWDSLTTANPVTKAVKY